MIISRPANFYRKDLLKLKELRRVELSLYQLISKIVITKDADPIIIKEIQSWNINPNLVITK